MKRRCVTLLAGIVNVYSPSSFVSQPDAIAIFVGHCQFIKYIVRIRFYSYGYSIVLFRIPRGNSNLTVFYRRNSH